MAKVSIIIPIYNAEKYLRPCLESINQQTYRDFEVILVDDGSRDSSKKICEEFCKKDPEHYKYYWKKNAGVSSARNFGISKSEGEWIMFIDADDMISECAIEQLLNTLDVEKDDMVVCGYTRNTSMFKVSSKITRYSSVSLIRLLLNSPNYKNLYSDLGELFDDIILMSVWAKLYKKAIIDSNGVKFKTNLQVCEDVVFNYEYFSYIKNVIFTHSVLYYYRITEGSASNKIDSSRIINLQNLVEVMIRFREESDTEMKHDFTVYCCKMMVIWFGKIKFNRALKEFFLDQLKEYDNVLYDCRVTDKLSRGIKQNIIYKINYYILESKLKKHD